MLSRLGPCIIFAFVLLDPLLVYGISSKFLHCQLQKPVGESALTGCPTGTLYISATSPEANFTSVQEAVLSLDDENNATILVGEGEYHETVNITRSAPLTLLGQLDRTALDPNSNSSSRNLVKIWNNFFTETGEDDAQSAVLIIAPSFNASLIGAGPTGAPLQPLFGNSDFKAYNIDFQNRAANFSISQALVTDISYANASFYGCAFESYQDTWYTGRNGSTYVVDSTIFGQTDYVFGFGTAWFQNITLANRACGGGIVAWKGTNLTDAPGNRYGAYFAGSQIIRSPDANITLNLAGQCFLGRPWNNLATTVFLDTFMDNTIQPAGWRNFSDTQLITSNTFYAEFNSTGPGGNTGKRISEEHILTAAQATAFTIDQVFLGTPSWIDFTYSSQE